MNAPVSGKSGFAGRARDSLQGLALGDAFGETWFRISAGEAERRLAVREVPAGPWPWTDDTAMAVSLYRILVDCGTVRQDDLARAFADAYRSDPYRGYGGSMHDVLRRIGAGEHWQEVTAGQFSGTGSWGNGAAMRVAPLGAWFAGDPDLAARQAALSAVVTHAHPEAAAGAVAVASAAAARGVVAADHLRDHPQLARGGPRLDRRPPPQQPGQLITGRARAAPPRPANLVGGQRQQPRRDQRVPSPVGGEPRQPGIAVRARALPAVLPAEARLPSHCNTRSTKTIRKSCYSNNTPVNGPSPGTTLTSRILSPAPRTGHIPVYGLIKHSPARNYRSLMGDVSGAGSRGFQRYAQYVRYAQGGGLTAEGRRRRELVQLAELDRVLDADPAPVIKPFSPGRVLP